MTTKLDWLGMRLAISRTRSRRSPARSDLDPFPGAATPGPDPALGFDGMRERPPGAVLAVRQGQLRRRHVDDELFARVQRHHDGAIAELTMLITWENASSRFSRAFRIPSQEFWKR